MVIVGRCEIYIYEKFFLKNKSDLGKIGVSFAKDLKNRLDIPISTIRCDNAGENKEMNKMMTEAELGINFEYTAVDTPQQNGVVERAFATLYGRVRAMINYAKLNEEMRKKL